MTDESDDITTDNSFSDENLEKIKAMMENLENSDISMNTMDSVFENLESGTENMEEMLESIQKMSESFEGMKDLMENLNDNRDISGSTKPDITYANLKKILYDFTNDLLKSFPELTNTLDDNLVAIINKEDTDSNVIAIRDYCLKIYPEKFFEILYQNEKIFEGDKPICLLPGIDFAYIWNENISDATRKTIWKYLQLLLFAIVSDMSDSTSFGDTAKLFEAIDNDAFKSKLQETILNMETCFDSSGNTSDSPFNIDESDLPDPDKLHDHMNKMLNGKLGNLAREIAEETASDININIDDESSVNDVFQRLFKDPTKLMNLVTKVGSKLDNKIKSGDLKESELLAEAAEMMQHMKNMPGMENLQNLFSKAGTDKMNMNAMQSHMKRNINLAKQKERMKNKISKPPPPPNKSEINNESIEASNQAAIDLLLSEGVKFEEMENYIFSTGESYEKSTRKSEVENSEKKRKKKKRRKQNK